MQLSFFDNWDILFLGAVVTFTIVIGFVVFISNKKSQTHQTFLGVSLFIAIWGMLNYLSYQPFQLPIAFTILRLTLASVTWMTFFFLLFSISFPRNKIKWKKIVLFVVSIWTLFVSILTLTPYVLKEVSEISSMGVITSATNGPGMPIFGMTTLLYTLLGACILLYKTLHADREDRKGHILITIGMLIMFFLTSITNLILPVVFNITAYLPLVALFALPFVTLTAYAIVKHHLFNIKVIATEALVIIIWIILFSKIFSGQTSTAILIDTLIFVATVPFGILLIRSVIKEVKHREELEILSGKLKKTADDLSVSNSKLEEANEKLKELDQAKSEFMSIASHQLRTPLAGIVGYLSMLTDGDYGKMEPSQQQVVIELYQASQRLVRLVNTFLNVTRIEAGRFTMNFADVNIVDVVTSEVKELLPTAEKKGIKLIYATATAPIMVTVDSDKIRDVFLNLIDNAIKYTPEGSVSVFVEQQGDQVHFHTKDTGVGIEIGESEHLFEKFVRGTGIARVAPNGSGLGLYIVKKITEAHHGKVWVESDGPDKGSSFHVSLPLQQAVVSEKK